MDRAKLEKIIYRCGWCGLPTDKDGNVLEVDPNKYLEEHKDCDAEQTHGCCCPDGDKSQQQQMVQVTHDMAIDAGMPEIEGQWISW